MIIKAKNFVSITNILESQYKDNIELGYKKKKFYLFEDFGDVLIKIKRYFNGR